MPSSSSPVPSPSHLPTGVSVPPPPPPQTSPKICFNSHCKESLPEPAPSARRKGWRLRSGEIAELCDRCSCAYEQGNFCESFHAEIPGWRNCETCGKRVHCGCIVSATTYVLLDAGGVDCVACARKSFTMAPNQMFASPALMHQHASDKRDFPARGWKPVNGPFSGQWRQTPHMWNLTNAQSDLQQRLSYEFDRPNNIEKLIPGGRHSISTHEKKFEELPDRITSSSLGTVPRDRYINRTSGSESVSFGTFRKEEGHADGLHDPAHLLGGHDSISIRRSVISDPCSTSSSGANPSLCVNPQVSSNIKEQSTSIITGLVASLPSANGSKDARFPSNPPQSQVSPSAKQFYNQGVVDTELHTQMLNGRPRFDGRARVPMLPRYWPRITDQELQQISGDTTSVITPLFEKMLSASDAGRIGRLVLPKKCAEAYFPTISQPEGLPLKVQDANGKEWVFQFRFWPNNNSRMYVLEGVTPCIQSMQLQAGDVVTFSRIDPEGKLIMGFRKASSSVAAEQESQTNKSINGLSTSPDGSSPVVDIVANLPLPANKPSTESKGTISMPAQASWSKVARAEFIQKDGPNVKSPQDHCKRKNNPPGSKIKRLRIENEDAMELKVTWEEAQELLRPPPDKAPTVVKIGGFELEEYEEAPVMGKRTYFTTNQTGENSQWAQCEDCSKWRKLPVDALLPFRWSCSDNVWDSDRNSCSSTEELNFEQLVDLIILSKAVLGASKRAKVKVERENVELSDGLGTLANLAILGEGENQTSQQTTKHPRHRPGCSCIVCIQPPSGKGPKHKQTCTCNVCLTVKRRFKTLMLRREKRQSEKEAEKVDKVENSRKQHQLSTSPDQSAKISLDQSLSTVQVVNSPQNNSSVVDEGPDRIKASSLKAPQIDLNIQPEREEEPSPKAGSSSMGSLLQNASI